MSEPAGLGGPAAGSNSPQAPQPSSGAATPDVSVVSDHSSQGSSSTSRAVREIAKSLVRSQLPSHLTRISARTKSRNRIPALHRSGYDRGRLKATPRVSLNQQKP